MAASASGVLSLPVFRYHKALSDQPPGTSAGGLGGPFRRRRGGPLCQFPSSDFLETNFVENSVENSGDIILNVRVYPRTISMMSPDFTDFTGLTRTVVSTRHSV